MSLLSAVVLSMALTPALAELGSKLAHLVELADDTTDADDQSPMLQLEVGRPNASCCSFRRRMPYACHVLYDECCLNCCLYQLATALASALTNTLHIGK